MKIGAGRPATLAALVALRRVRDPASVVTEDPHPRHPLPPTCSHTYMSPHTLCVHACEHRKTHPKRSEKLTPRCSLNGALKASVCQAMLRKMGAILGYLSAIVFSISGPLFMKSIRAPVHARPGKLKEPCRQPRVGCTAHGVIDA